MENPVHSFPEIKREALHLLIELQDEALLAEVHRILSANGDWWDDLTLEEQAGLDEADRQLDAGESYTNEEVKARVKEWIKR